MPAWQLQEAKARLSELVKEVARNGPQEITVHGRAVAVMLSKLDYERLSGSSQSLLEFMRKSPLFGRDVPGFPRDRSRVRKLKL